MAISWARWKSTCLRRTQAAAAGPVGLCPSHQLHAGHFAEKNHWFQTSRVDKRKRQGTGPGGGGGAEGTWLGPCDCDNPAWLPFSSGGFFSPPLVLSLCLPQWPPRRSRRSVGWGGGWGLCSKVQTNMYKCGETHTFPLRFFKKSMVLLSASPNSPHEMCIPNNRFDWPLVTPFFFFQKQIKKRNNNQSFSL